MNKKTIANLNKFGWELCENGRFLNEVHGEGLTVIALSLGLTWQQANSATNAGRELNRFIASRNTFSGNLAV